MKKLLITICLILTISVASAQFENPKIARIKAVAVTSGENPTGVVINITVIVTEGNGKVFVSTTPYTEIDMQGSAQLAALTACDLLGIDFTKYDFFYVIEADAPIVGGPSAGAVMTIATIAALKGLKLNPYVYMSGMIYPDGFIGPVGGLNYKLEAAAKSGGKIFLIPKGQRIIYVEEKKVQRIGFISIITTEIKKMDLVDYGKRFGVEVYEVETINDALKFYTGYEIKKPTPTFNITEYSAILRKLAEGMKKSIEELGIRNERIDELIDEAKEYYNKGLYYTATSRYFEAKILMRYELYKNEIKTAKDFDKEVERISKEITEMKKYLKNAKIGIESFQLFAAAQERIGEAERLLEKAKTARSNEDALYYLAYAKERVESAKLWLSLLPEIKEDYELNPQEVKKRAEFYFSQARSIFVYASSLSGNEYLLNKAYQSIELSRTLLKDELYAGASVVAVDAIVQSSLAIELKYGSIDVKDSEQSAKLAISEVENSVIPILPAAYYEFAKTSNDRVLKVMYYKLSERLAKLLGVMSKLSSEKKLVYTEFKPPSVTETRKIEVTPGFEITIGFIAIVITYYMKRRNT